LLSASTGDNTVAWHENQLGKPSADEDGFGSRQVISANANGAHAVHAARVDEDGLVDVLSASTKDNKVSWYENQSSGSDLGEGLIAHYPFDGNANDASGNGNDGTLNGDPQFVNGVTGQSISFDGDGDFVQTGSSSSLQVDESLSISAWVYYESSPSRMTISVQGTDFDTDGNWQSYLLSDGKVSLGENNTPGCCGARSNGSIPAKSWNHVAVSFSSGTTKFYFNGELDSVKEVDNSSFNTTSDGIKIGDREYTGDENDDFDGRMDAFRLYNRALTESEVQELYAGGGSNGIVQGEIVDAQTGNAVSGATVSLENRSVSDVTDEDGSYSLLVEPGTDYTVTAGAEGYYSGNKSYISVDGGETTTVDLSLQPLEQATPVVTTLTPDPNPNSSSVGPGGQAIRYYRIISSGNGTPLPNQPLTVESEDGSSYTFRSDQSGVASVSIPAAEVGSESSSKTFSLTSVAGQAIPESEQRSFTVNVFSRVYTQGWALRTFGEIGAGLDFSGENTGKALLRGLTNSEEAAQLEIQRRKRGGIGIELGISTPRIEVGENGLGAGASVGSSLFFYQGDAHSFNWQASQSPQEAAAQFYVWARSVFPIVSNNVIRLLSYVGENLDLTEELEASYKYDEFGVGNQTYGSASFQAGLGTLTDMTVGVKGGIGGDFEAYSSARWLTDGQYEIGGNLEAGFSLEAGATVPLLSVDPSDDGPDGSGDGRALRKDLSDVGVGFEQLGGQAEVEARWQGGIGMGCQPGNAQYLFFETATSVEGPLGDISNSYPDGTEGVATGRRYRFDIEPALEPAWEGGAGNDTAQTLATSCGAEGVLNFGRSTFAGLIEALGGQAGLANEDPNLSYPPVEYSADSTLTTSESDVDLSISGALGIEVSVGLGGSFAERRNATVEEGVWATGRHYPIERYNDLPSLEASYKDVVLDVVGDIPSSFWDSALDIVDAIPNPFSNNKVAAASDSTYSYQIGDNGTTVVFDNEAVPPEVDSIQGVSWGWWGSSTNTLAKDLSPQSRQFKK